MWEIDPLGSYSVDMVHGILRYKDNSGDHARVDARIEAEVDRLRCD